MTGYIKEKLRFVLLGFTAVLLIISVGAQAVRPFFRVEGESGALSGTAFAHDDDLAANGSYLGFNALASTPQIPEGLQFLADFNTPGQEDELFRKGTWHRERNADGFDKPLWVSPEPWQADHNIHLADCGDPVTNTHEVRTRNEGPRAADGQEEWWFNPTFEDERSFYACRNHFMVTMGHVSGYSVAWFSPNKQFDAITEVCWDVDIGTDWNGHRQWWEVAVMPVSEIEDVSAIGWLAGTANLPSYAEVNATVLGFGPDNPPHPKISVGGNEAVASGNTYDPEARNSKAIRRPHCFKDNKNGTVTYTTVQGDGSPYSFSGPGQFPPGKLKVVFKNHDYTPDKDCEFMTTKPGRNPAHFPNGSCQSWTWHWDNIKVR